MHGSAFFFFGRHPMAMECVCAFNPRFVLTASCCQPIVQNNSPSYNYNMLQVANLTHADAKQALSSHILSNRAPRLDWLLSSCWSA